MILVAGRVLVGNRQRGAKHATGLVDLVECEIEAIADRDSVFVIWTGENLDGPDGDRGLGSGGAGTQRGGDRKCRQGNSTE